MYYFFQEFSYDRDLGNGSILLHPNRVSWQMLSPAMLYALGGQLSRLSVIIIKYCHINSFFLLLTNDHFMVSPGLQATNIVW